MSTYKKIQTYVKQKHGFVPKTCWIADAKEKFGLPVKKAWNRRGEERENPCPPAKLEAIRDAFEFFEMFQVDIHLLFKIGGKKYMSDLYENGTIFMNTVGFFIDFEEKELRGDKDEGLAGIEQIAELKILDKDIKIELARATYSSRLKYRDDENKGNIYSLIAITSRDDPENYRIDEKNKELGDSFVVISNVHEFIKRIENEFKALKFDYKYNPVQYYGPKEYSGPLNIFCKQKYFEYQKEFRIFVKKDEDGPIKIEIGSIKDISYIFDIEKLDIIKLNFSKPEEH